MMTRSTMWRTYLGSVLLCAASVAGAERSLFSTSFSPCESTNQLDVSSFNVSITPDNMTIEYDYMAENMFSGNATVNYSIIINGTKISLFYEDPCIQGNPSLCPSSLGQIALSANIVLNDAAQARLPEDLYTESGLDAQFLLEFNNTATGQAFGCVQANLTNGVADAATNNGTTSSDNNVTTSSSNDSGSTNGTTQEGSQSAANTMNSFLSVLTEVFTVIVLALWL